MKAERRASARPRTGARVAAVQALFQSEHTGESVETVADQFIRHRIGTPTGPIEFEEGGVPEAHIPLFQAILKQVAAHAEVADAAIVDCLQKGWTLDRLDPVLRALLRAARNSLNVVGGRDGRDLATWERKLLIEERMKRKLQQQRMQSEIRDSIRWMNLPNCTL
jgi:transcription termination factor NusB